MVRYMGLSYRVGIFDSMGLSYCEATKDVLDKYAQASGQRVNYVKSAMCVSPRIRRQYGERLAGLIRVQLVECH